MRAGLSSIAVVTGIWLGGCDRYFAEEFRQRDAGPKDAVDAPSEAAPVPCLVERFDAPLDPAAWELRPITDMMVTRDVDNLLFAVDMNVPGGDASVAAFRSLAVTNVVDGSIEVRLVEPPGEGLGSGIRLSNQFSHRYEIAFQNEGAQIDLYAFAYDGGSRVDRPPIPYDPIKHRWLRIQHSSAAASVVFQTSDGTTWDTFLTVPPETTDLSAITVEVVSFVKFATASQRIARWDDVQIRDATCVPHAEFPP